jgi:glycosyltransferase involved in cell wall biosynthesis
MEPKISICIPAYNGEAFLKECLDSVLAQTYSDFEVLIVDDGSTDSTLDMAREYSRSDKRFRLYHNETNLGLVRNWNKCLALSRGEWIKFVFQDDFLLPACAQRMIAAQGCGTPFIVCNREFIFECTEEHRRYYTETVKHLGQLYCKDTLVPHTDFSRLILAFLTNKNVGNNFVGEPTNILIRKDAIYEVGWFNPELIQCCDYEYWSRLGSNYGAYIIPDILSRFRIHQGSTTNYNRREMAFRKDHLDLLAVIHDYLFHPLYLQFRQAIGEEGRAELLRYATNTLKRTKSCANDAAGGQEKMEFQRFMDKYPVYAELFNRDNFDYVKKTLRGYLKSKMAGMI